MAYVVTDPDTVTAAGYTSPTPGITATEFANINSQKIVVAGDIVDTHTNPLPTTHAAATMVNSQTFFRVNGKLVILVGDQASCDVTHTVTSSTQTFVNVT